MNKKKKIKLEYTDCIHFEYCALKENKNCLKDCIDFDDGIFNGEDE